MKHDALGTLKIQLSIDLCKLKSFCTLYGFSFSDVLKEFDLFHCNKE